MAERPTRKTTMSLYGALMIGVSALDAFSNALSTTSSNIANVNTIGYKTGQARFSTLLAASMGEGDMSSAGVISSETSNITQQGLLQTASSPTDLAVSGDGFFMVSANLNRVNANVGSTNGLYYTRAGDFNPDANGNLANSAGYYLMGYAVNADGSVSPGTPLSGINVTNLTGKAEPTSNMSIQANLQASTDIYDDSQGTYSAGMLSDGTITPDFTQTINVYDSQGGSQPVTISWLKTGANQWDYEVSYAGDLTKIGSPANGMLYHGQMTFNTDGTLANGDALNFSGSPTGSIDVNIPWDTSTSGLAPQSFSVNFGTLNASNGMSQFDSASTLTNSSVDGALFGTLLGVTVDNEGIVTAQFSNGLTQKIYQIPLATFTNTNGLAGVSGNAYAASAHSGNAVVSGAGNGGAGKIQGSALEGSTVDLATEFTNLITTQRAYAASTRVITTASEMLDQLTQMVH
jgi:flagellar hook protein FlgE